MANISSYWGVWPRGYNPTDGEVENGTGAVASDSGSYPSGQAISELLIGLSDDTDYDLEWFVRDADSNTARGVTAQFTTDAVAPVVLIADDLEAAGAIQGGSVGSEHILTADHLQNVGQIRSEAITHTHDLSADDLENGGVIEGGAVGHTHELSAGDLESTGGIDGVLFAGPGRWNALPISTLLFDDVYDENDVLAGDDAHESLNDLSDDRWIRAVDSGPNRAPRLDLGFDSGLGGVQVERVDSANVFLRIGMYGTWADDDMSLSVIIMDSADNPITELVDVSGDLATIPNIPTFTSVNVGFTTFSTDRDDYIGAYVELRWEYTKVAADDNAALAVSRMRFYGRYTGELIGLDGAAEIEGAAISQEHLLDAGDLENTGGIQSASIGAGSFVDPDDLESGGAIEGATLTQEHILTVGIGLEGGGAVEGGSVVHIHELTADDLENGGAIQGASITQDHALDAGNLSGNSKIQYATLPSDTDVPADDMVNDGTIEGVAIVQEHILTAGHLTSGSAIQGASLEQEKTLEAGHLESGGAIQGASLSQAQTLEADDLESGGAIESGSIDQNPVLQGDDLENGGAIEGATVGQTHVLSCGNLSQGNEIQGATLAQDHILQAGNLASTGAIKGAQFFLRIFPVTCPKGHPMPEYYAGKDVSDVLSGESIC